MTLVANARMYAVTPTVTEAWRSLFAWVGRRSGIDLAYREHAAPEPLERLWSRPDLGLAFVCGYPFACGTYGLQPIAAPLPSSPRYGGLPVYCTDLVVRTTSGIRTLAEAVGGRIGWTVENSQSGYQALRSALAPLRRDRPSPLFRASVGPLSTPRRVIEALLADEIDLGPLDSYVHDLLRRHDPDTAGALRTVASTELTPMPLLAASGVVPALACEGLRNALLAASASEEARPLLGALLLDGFREIDPASYDQLRVRAADADAAGLYPPF